MRIVVSILLALVLLLAVWSACDWRIPSILR